MDERHLAEGAGRLEIVGAGGQEVALPDEGGDLAVGRFVVEAPGIGQLLDTTIGHTATTSAMLRASSWSWVTMTAVVSAARRMSRTSVRRRARRAVSRFEKGSSRSTRAGCGAEGAGECHALLLAAGEALQGTRGETIQADQFQQFLRAAVALRAAAAQAEGDVAGDVEVREEGVILKDHTDAAVFRRDEAAGSGDLAAGDMDFAAVGALEAGDEAQRGGFAAAAEAEQGE